MLVLFFCLLFLHFTIVNTHFLQIVIIFFGRYVFNADFYCLISFKLGFLEIHTSGFSVIWTLGKKISNLFVFYDSQVSFYDMFMMQVTKITFLTVT